MLVFIKLWAILQKTEDLRGYYCDSSFGSDTCPT